MKFVKTVIDGKEYYRMLDEEEIKTEDTAENKESEASEETIVEGEVVDGEEGEVNYTEKLNEFFEQAGENMRELGEKIKVGAKDLGEKIKVGAKDFSRKVKDGTERIFKDKSTDPASTAAQLLRLLPYMDAESVHEICEKLLASDETLKNLDVAAVLPFFSVSDCDALFLQCVLAGNKNYEMEKVAPYVSRECLTKIVDNYLAGKCRKLDIDTLYPYLPSEEIKRIFYNIINNGKN